jgi:hypothetical protein
MTGTESERQGRKENRGEELEFICHLEVGTLQMRYVKVIYNEFIKIYDSRSYIEGLEGLRTQSIHVMLKKWKEQSRICTRW